MPAAEAQKVNLDGGNLIYPGIEEALAQGASAVEQVRNSTVVDPVQRVEEVLWRQGERSSALEWPSRVGSDELLMCFTDLEPDDVMAIAQLWEWSAERKRTRGPPLVVFQANMQEKDYGSVLEKKQLVAQLMLGLPSYYTLFKGFDQVSDHPQHQGLIEQRQAHLDGICQDLVNFEGSLIHLCVMAPGSGNLQMILRRLKAWNKWPLRAKWRISMYSGSFNMRGMTHGDMAALNEIMACSELPLLDVAKFPFFGGSDCHKWTDSLTTFATPSFASDLADRSPSLAAALKLFNDEFNAMLIAPKKLIKKDLEPEVAARFAEIKKLFDPSDGSKLREYTRALLADEVLMSKVPGFKKSTIRAFAYGGCDSPLCDQLIFLHEWLSERRPGFIKYEEGYWRYNAEKAFVEIVASPKGLSFPMKVRRPVVALPSNEEHLQEMRHALQTYLMRHLHTMDSHISREPRQPEVLDGCNLIYPLTEDALARGASLVQQVRNSTLADPAQRVQEVLQRRSEGSSSRQWPSRRGCDELLVCFTDFEPDDAMAIAQLWEWGAEAKRISGPPLVIFQANLQEKDFGTVLEKKQLMAQLMLGLPSYYTLAKDGDTAIDHPQHQGLLEQRQAYLDGICQDLVEFQGSLIHLCVMAPGSGNLAAILRELKARSAWPLRAKWRISMYSGSFNMRGMTPGDMEALSEIMACSELPLLDVAKFPFFGGSGCHKWTDSLTTFAAPGFAADLTDRFPDLAAALKLFNDEFNARLIEPKKLIKKDLEPEDAARFAEIKKLFDPSDGSKLGEYTRALLDDEGLMSKVPGFKKSTMKAFAYGGCDSPLCDQLIFLHEWLSDRRPAFIRYEEGYWRYNEEKAFVEIVPSPEGLPHSIKARRPLVASPSNEEHLQEMRVALHDYLMRHLDEAWCNTH